ncbi:MAG: hypothetical protein ACP5M0_11840, partial [Desulfomonilaceae bacterium]
MDEVLKIALRGDTVERRRSVNGLSSEVEGGDGQKKETVAAQKPKRAKAGTRRKTPPPKDAAEKTA